MSILLGQDTDVIKLDVVTNIYAVLSHGCFLDDKYGCAGSVL